MAKSRRVTKRLRKQRKSARKQSRKRVSPIAYRRSRMQRGGDGDLERYPNGAVVRTPVDSDEDGVPTLQGRSDVLNKALVRKG